MKIFYKDSEGERRLQDANIVVRKTTCDYDHGTEDVYQILNITTEFVHYGFENFLHSIADILTDNGWGGDELRYIRRQWVDEDLEEKQSIYFGGNCVLSTSQRDAFWVAITEALERSDKIFDTEKWFAKHKEEVIKND